MDKELSKEFFEDIDKIVTQMKVIQTKWQSYYNQDMLGFSEENIFDKLVSSIMELE